MRSLRHLAASFFLRKTRIPKMEAIVDDPVGCQQEMFEYLVHRARNTAWGKLHDYANIENIADFQAKVPVNTYETFFPFIERVLKGQKYVLWPGKVKWFAKSSGTTNDRSKFIPMTNEILDDNHFACGKDMLAQYFELRAEDSNAFAGKILSIGGSHQISRYNKNARAGDLSAVLIQNMPFTYELSRVPSRKVALMSDWDDKLEAMAREAAEENVTAIAGVPTWTWLVVTKAMEVKGITSGNLHDLWPNLEVFYHGGVNFEPYREQFRQLMPAPHLSFMEVYNASEGFFAFQTDLKDRGLQLLLSHGIFFEFIPLSEVGKLHPKALTIGEVEVGETYAMLISTVGGLWRYAIGDTVRFTSTYPHKIVVAGRTKHFINAFGEELMVGNAEAAIAEACAQTGATVKDFTAGPIYAQPEHDLLGTHEWVIEFDQRPNDPEHFNRILDAELQRVNGDYGAKRAGDFAMRFPVIHHAPSGTFESWMRQRGKLGGQNKVPRLANHRDFLEGVLALLPEKA